MMASYSFGSLVGVHLHFLFMLLVIVAAVAGVVWLSRFSDKKEFLNAIWVSLIVGIVGLLLTAGWSSFFWGYGYRRHMNGNQFGPMMNQMMNYMQQEFQERNMPFDRQEMLEHMREEMDFNI